MRGYALVSMLVASIVIGCSDDAAETDPGAVNSSSTAAGGGIGGMGGSPTSAAGGSGGMGGSISMTPCTGMTCDLTLVGSNFDAYEGKTLYAGLQVQGQMGLDFQTSVVISGGAFNQTDAGVLDKGRSYNLNYFVDINDSGGCELTPADAVWRIQVANVQTHLTISVGGDDPNLSNLGCSGFP